MNWKTWLIGLLNGAIDGLASGGISAGLGIGWKQYLTIAGGTALVSVWKWIVQHPLPGTPTN